MNTENLEQNTSVQTPAQPNVKTFTEDEVEEMVKRRRERDAENLRTQAEENKKLKARLEELESKFQKGTASTEEMQQLDAAKKSAANAQAQGYSPEQVQAIVQSTLEQKQFTDKLQDAYSKDPEFKKLVDQNKGLTEKQAPEGFYAEEINALAYLPNAVAVAKHLMKDPKSMKVFKTAFANYQYSGSPVEAMMVLNNFSDRLQDKSEIPHAPSYEPAAPLSDASDESQAFDVKNYINSKY